MGPRTKEDKPEGAEEEDEGFENSGQAYAADLDQVYGTPAPEEEEEEGEEEKEEEEKEEAKEEAKESNEH